MCVYGVRMYVCMYVARMYVCNMYVNTVCMLYAYLYDIATEICVYLVDLLIYMLVLTSRVKMNHCAVCG